MGAFCTVALVKAPVAGTLAPIVVLFNVPWEVSNNEKEPFCGVVCPISTLSNVLKLIGLTVNTPVPWTYNNISINGQCSCPWLNCISINIHVE